MEFWHPVDSWDTLTRCLFTGVDVSGADFANFYESPGALVCIREWKRTAFMLSYPLMRDMGNLLWSHTLFRDLTTKRRFRQEMFWEVDWKPHKETWDRVHLICRKNEWKVRKGLWVTSTRPHVEAWFGVFMASGDSRGWKNDAMWPVPRSGIRISIHHCLKSSPLAPKMSWKLGSSREFFYAVLSQLCTLLFVASMHFGLHIWYSL